MEKLDISVLYVEDEGLFRNVLVDFLGTFVKEVFVAENGQEGLRMYQQHKPDLLITDIAMPFMNGLKLIKEIKKDNPLLRTIVTTSFSETEYFLEAIELGVDRFMLKPFNRQNFSKIIFDIGSIIDQEKKSIEQERIRKEAEEALKESEDRFRSLFNQAPEAILLADPETTKVLDANIAAIQLLGYSYEELLTKCQKDLIPENEYYRLISTFTPEWLRQNPEHTFELNLKSKKGEIIPAEVKEKFIRFKGKPILFGYFTNLTVRKKAESAIAIYQNQLEELVDQRTAELSETNRLLLLEIEERKIVESRLKQRSLIEKTISEFSTGFLAVHGEAIGSEITKTLERISDITHADRAFLWFIDSKTFRLKTRYIWAAEGKQPSVPLVIGQSLKNLTYIFSRFSNHLNVNLPDTSVIDNDLPDSKYFNGNRSKSVLMVPLFNDTLLEGFIGIDSQTRFLNYDEDDEFLLNMAGKIITTSVLRGKAEQRLAESEEKAHALLNASNDSMILIDLDGKILEANEGATHLFGKPLETLLSKNVQDFSPVKIAVKRNEVYQQVVRTGKKVEYFDVDNGRSFEHVVYPVTNSNEVVDRIAVMTRDVTDKLKNEIQIKNHNHFLQTLLNNLPNPVYYKDTQHRYLGCNQEFLKAIGKTFDEIVGKTIFEIQPTDVAQLYYEWDEILFRERAIQSFESKILYADGYYHDILFNKAVFYNFDGELGGLIGIMIDITELKRYQTELKELNQNLEQRVIEELGKTEQQRQLLIQKSKLESLGKLAAGMAHEINQPLGGISMGLENIMLKANRNQLSNNYLKEKINHLYENISRIKLIIDHIRTFSRDQQRTAFSKVNLNDVVDSTLLLVGTQYSNHSIKLTINKYPKPLYYNGNQYKLEQVLLNLLSNAKDAVDDKADQESVGYERNITIATFEEKNVVVLSITDNGTGIPEDVKEHIFEPFFTTKEIAKGTGLGLSIVYGIIEEVKGSIKIESKKGEFTRITVTLPQFQS